MIWPLPAPLTLCSTIFSIFSSFFTPQTLAFFMFLEYARLFPTLRPLHLLFPPMRYSAPSQDFWSFRSQLKDHLFSEALPDLSIQISMLPPSHSKHLPYLKSHCLFNCYLLIVFLCLWNVNFMRTAHYCISRI